MEQEQNTSQIEEGQDLQGYENSTSQEYYQKHGDEESSSFRTTQREDGYLQEQEVIEACQSINTSPRKRKIDKDGFVTPATPDIPKSSCHYGQTKQMRIDGITNNEGEGYSLDNVVNHVTGQLQDENCTVNQMPSSSQKVLHSFKPIVDVMKDLSEESKNVHDQFSNMFRESEEYETICPEKLDKLIGEATALEENLNQQKQVLCSRLKALSRTLQLL
ncbi:uncharacterized protein LOC117344277 [Pecten maximus]|uniref:uncharacterized protein LOC117344277 n=1 Tax=Pecten maximus TaxID=6579 RepID=UPI001458EAB0|nr:uncharacterized protein LOC117344277 [Pecten maximus]